MSGPKAPPREYLETGTVVGDRYEIRRRLGSGGIGDVYKAVDTRLGNREVAIKMLSTTIAAGPLAEEVRGRFMLEAQALSAIRDDHVVSVLNFGFTSAGVPYLVMEYLEGQDLETLLKASGGLLSIRHAVDVALDVCGGVYICHNEEIVHRDLKPANIFLERTPRGDRAKVVDFGISKTAASAKLSRPGVAMGTPKYMAPEQLARGQTDKRSDQYAIGLILYRCLTGRLPDKGGGPDAKDVRPEIPEMLNESVMRALAQDPDERFPSVYALGRSLMPLASDQASARWREYYRTPPQPRSNERSAPVPVSFTKPDGRFDPSTIRVSYDAATRMGSVDETTTNKGGIAATEVDLHPLAANEGVPQPIPVLGGGTAPDHRRGPAPRRPSEGDPAESRRRGSPIPELRTDDERHERPSPDAPPLASAPPATSRKALILTLVVAVVAGSAGALYWSGRLPGLLAPRPRQAAAMVNPSALPQKPSPPREPTRAAPAPPPLAPPPMAAPPVAAPAPELAPEPVTPSARREHHHGKRSAPEAERSKAAPDAGVPVRYTGDRDPILE
jgi:serine/threonine protein kinase